MSCILGEPGALALRAQINRWTLWFLAWCFSVPQVQIFNAEDSYFRKVE
jgi:hypothetical protein